MVEIATIWAAPWLFRDIVGVEWGIQNFAIRTASRFSSVHKIIIILLLVGLVKGVRLRIAFMHILKGNWYVYSHPRSYSYALRE